MKVSCNIGLSFYLVATVTGKGYTGTLLIPRSDMRACNDLVIYM